MPEHVTDHTPGGVALRCVRVVTWSHGRPHPIDGGDLETTSAREVLARERPLWLQLALPRLSDAEQSWFEGSVDPWIDVERPEVSWAGVEPVLEHVGLLQQELDEDEARLLRRLPYVFERGVARTAREVWGSAPAIGSVPADRARPPRFFAGVAFLPVAGDDAHCFWTVRLTLAAIRNVVVTVRLPDLRWDDEKADFAYCPGGPLDVPGRFFPLADDIGAEDIADGIALHLASTAREVTKRIRPELMSIERRWARSDDKATSAVRGTALADARHVTNITETLYQLDRQVSRLLRRFGPEGTDDRPALHVPSGIAQRYRFALDELRSLEADCRLASDAAARAINEQEREDRERFHLVAAMLASAILIPTLVATVYGANVKLPAEQTPRGFIALMLFIVACAFAGWLVISEWWQRAWGPDDEQPRSPARVAAAVVAVAAFAAGVLEVT